MKSVPARQAREHDGPVTTKRERQILNNNSSDASVMRASIHHKQSRDHPIGEHLSLAPKIQDIDGSKRAPALRKNNRTISHAKPEQIMTTMEILAPPPPPDEPEYISTTTASRKSQSFWAPLIGGTSMQEKTLIEEELGITSQPTVHPEWIKTRTTDPGNFNRLLYFEGVDPDVRYPIAGLSKEPLSIDPPGSGTPYDALRFPHRLVKLLSRKDWRSFYDWNEEVLDSIPSSILTQLNEAALSRLPISIRNKTSSQTLSDSLPARRNEASSSAIRDNLPLETLPKLRTRNMVRAAMQGEEPSSSEISAIILSRKTSPQPLRFPRRRDAKGHFVTISTIPRQEATVTKSHFAFKEKTRDQENTHKRAKDQSDDKYQVVPCESCSFAGIQCDGTLPACWWCVAQGWLCIRSQDKRSSPTDTSTYGIVTPKSSGTTADPNVPETSSATIAGDIS